MKAVYNGADHGNWVSNGNEYQVTSLLSDKSGRVSLQIITNQNSLGMSNAADYTLSDSTIPSGWSVHLYPDGGVKVGPAPFLVPGFWEEYYNSEPDAIATVISILGFDPGR